MTIWNRISNLAQDVGDTITSLLGSVSGTSTPPEKSVAFTIGMIALGAKMAKADGVVSDSEVLAFSQVFHVPEKDRAAVNRVSTIRRIPDEAGAHRDRARAGWRHGYRGARDRPKAYREPRSVVHRRQPGGRRGLDRRRAGRQSTR